MRVSCVVRAHPTRCDLVEGLLAALDRPVEVIWDRGDNGWDTGVRAWQAVDPGADWGFVIEDDAVVCRDLIAGLERALAHVPAASVVSAYLGNKTALRIFDAAVRQAESAGAAWIRATSLVWGVGIAVPTASIVDMLTWGGQITQYDSRVYDTRIARYYSHRRRWPAYYTWPSLIDHRQVPSLIGHEPGRCARRFLGEDVSALEVDWSGETVQGRTA